MAGVDDADLVAVVEEGVVEPVVLYAGQAEEGVDAVGDQGFYGGFSAGFEGHGSLLWVVRVLAQFI